MQSERKFNERWVATFIWLFFTAQSFAQSDGQELRKVVATGAGMNEDQALKNQHFRRQRCKLGRACADRDDWASKRAGNPG
jgi:hypothetical protein